MFNVGFLVSLLVLVAPWVSCRQAERADLGGSVEDAPSTPANGPTLRTRLLAFADSVGVDTSTFQVPAGADSIRALLREIRYGHPPKYLRYLGLEEHLDTLTLRTAHQQLLTFAPPLAEAVPQPPSAHYRQLLRHYQRLRQTGQPDSLAALRETLNAYRWMSRFTDGQPYAVVSIPATELVVLHDTGEVLRMRVIVGTKTHQTPSFATYCSQIITYPYWHVPQSIAVREMLPKIKRSTHYLESQNLQVLGADGQPVDPATVAWAELNAQHFPYRLRQSTGCDNALGLIKFDLQSPYAIYLHDTNARSLFGREARWLSHGCIRLQKPIELANLMLGENRMNDDFLTKCQLDAKPTSLALNRPFPVFMMYLLVDLDRQGNLRWSPNIYNWKL